MLQGIASLMVSRKGVPTGITLIQSKPYGSVDATHITHTITFDNPPAQGNVMVLCVVSDTTVTNPPAGGWALVDDEVDFTGTYMFWKLAGVSESSSIVVTLDNADTVALAACEVFGVSTLDKQNGLTGQGASTVINTGTTATTTAANEFVITLAGGMTPADAFVSWDNSVLTLLDVVSTGSGALQHLTSGYKIVSSTGAFTANATYGSAGSGHCSGIIGTFK